MRNFFLITSLLIINTLIFVSVFSSDNKNGNDSKSEEIFFSRLSRQSCDVFSITSHFTQTKYLTLINSKLVSEGTFYYQKKGKIRFDYKQPKSMSIIMMPDKLQIIAAEKKTTYDFSTQKSLADMAVVMEACISGKIKDLPKNYVAEYRIEKDAHVIRITQLKVSDKSPYALIELRLNLRDYSLEQLTLFEKSDDFTTYNFSDILVNQNLKSSLFMI